VVDTSRIWVDTVKRGSLVFQVRGLGTVVSIANAFEAKIQIPEPQSRGIQVGQPVTIDTRQGLVAGKVIAVSSQINNGEIEVEVSLEGNASANLKAGLTVDGVIEIGRSAETLYVGRPVHGRPNSTATRVSVKLGQSAVSTIEIVDGLKVGDKVIVSDMGDYEGAAMIKLK
jgi:HlyD family secretion protein